MGIQRGSTVPSDVDAQYLRGSHCIEPVAPWSSTPNTGAPASLNQ
jgi:hypothetical protein